MVSIDTLVSVGATDRYQSMIDIEGKVAHPSVMRTYQETTHVQSEHIGFVDALPRLAWTGIRPPSLRTIMAVYEHHRMMVQEERARFLFPCAATAVADAASPKETL